MLDKLHLIEKTLHTDGLLEDANEWESLDVNYELPRVERLWRQIGDLRVYLHRIQACSEGEALFHPHPWPSAMRIIRGAYQMNVGYGKGDIIPPVAASIRLSVDNTYEMCDPDGWHSVRPLTPDVYTVMVTGTPWGRSSPKSTHPLYPLDRVNKANILDVFRSFYERKL